MRAPVTGLSAAAMLAATTLVSVPSAQAGSGYYGGAPVIDARYKGNNWKCGKYGNCGHHRNYRRNYHHHHGHDNFPGGLILGLGAGALIGSAIAQPHYYGNSRDAYCSRKYKTYKPWTGTYTGYDGRQHRCR